MPPTQRHPEERHPRIVSRQGQKAEEEVVNNFRGKIFVLSLALVAWFVSNNALGAKLEMGDEAPLFTLKVLNTEVTEQTYVNLNDYAKPLDEGGKKATFLTFFATYCEPCKRELPYLVQLKRLRAEGFQVMMITIDKDAAEVAKAKAMAKELGADFPLLNDRFGIVARRYGVESLWFLIDLRAWPMTNGVRWKMVGEASDAIPDGLGSAAWGAGAGTIVAICWGTPGSSGGARCFEEGCG